MGPSIIFDKSALQALSVDESVWLDAFFQTNIVPMFYVETLADLSKVDNKTRPPEDLVALLATKTPGSAFANVHHRHLVAAELAGYNLPLGQPVIAGGQTMRSTDETIGIHLDESLEARALRRWGQHEFEAVERDAARQWRVELAAHDARVLVDAAMGLLPRDRKISSLEQLKAYVDELCISRSAHVFDLAMDVIGIGATARNFALTRWNWRSRPPLAHFAPYTAHVVKVDLVFHLAIARGFISGERPSNRVDMAYLYYAPFANVFVSGDRLHHRTVPFFQTPDQAYLTCRQLKDSLAEFDAHYEQLPNEIKRLGVMRFALCPPSTIENAVTRLWDRYMHPDWRSIAAKMEASVNEPPDLASEKQTVAELNERLDTATVVPDETAVQDQREGPDYWLVKRFVAPTKGRWQILPDDLAS